MITVGGIQLQKRNLDILIIIVFISQDAMRLLIMIRMSCRRAESAIPIMMCKAKTEILHRKIIDSAIRSIELLSNLLEQIHRCDVRNGADFIEFITRVEEINEC